MHGLKITAPLHACASLACAMFLAVPAPGQSVPAARPNSVFSTNGSVTAIAETPRREYFIGGIFDEVNGIPRSHLARVRYDGALDLTFAPALDFPVSALITDGPFVYVGGIFSTIDGEDVNGLARFFIETGVRDSAWRPSPMNNGFAASVNGFAIDDGFLYVAGDFTEIDRLASRGLVRFHLDSGRVDEEWTPDLSRGGSTVRVTDVAAGGEGVFFAGQFTEVSDIARAGLAKVSARAPATLDPAFNPAPNSTPGTLLLHEGSLYVGGAFTSIGGVAQSGLARLDPVRGAVDPQWTGVTTGGDPVFALAADRNYLFVGGNFDRISGAAATDLATLILSKNGAFLEPGFDPISDLVDRDGSVGAVHVSGDSQIVIGGSFSVVGKRISASIARLQVASGQVDDRFSAQVTRPGTINAIVQQDDGKVIVGGVFLSVDGLERRNLARFDAAGRLDPLWTPAPNAAVNVLATAGTDVFVGGDFTEVSGFSTPYLAKFGTAADRPDLGWIPEIDGGPGALHIVGSSIYVGAPFASRQSVARIPRSGDGSADPDWNAPSAPATVLALASSRTAVFIGGSDPQLALLTQVSAADGKEFSEFRASFAHAGGGIAAVEVLELAAEGIYVGGNFTGVGGATRRSLARIDTATGAVDTRWNPALDGDNVVSKTFVYDLAATRDGLYVGGRFTSADGEARTSIARLSRQLVATPDRDWDFVLNIPTTINGIVEDRGALYIGGRFSTVGGRARQGAALLAKLDRPVFFRTSRVFVFPGTVPGTSHFQLTDFVGGTLVLPDDPRPLKTGSFITVAEGAQGLIWKPEGNTTQFVSFASAVSSDPAGVASGEATLDLFTPPPLVTGFVEATHQALEGDATVTLEVETTASGGTIDYTVTPGTATAFDAQSVTGDYFDPGATTLDLTGGGIHQFAIAIFDDSDQEGDEIFTVTLSNPTGGAILGSQSTATVTVIDNEIVGSAGPELVVVTPSPPDPGPANGVLEVTLSNDAGLGQWRLLGEVDWRDAIDDGGAPAGGLTTGNFIIEFRPVDGLLEPAPLTVPVDGTDPTPVSVNGTYVTNTQFNPGAGALSVMLEPLAAATAVLEDERAQWRRQGETVWRDSGDMIPDLPAGLHAVEFKPVPGRIVPASRLVNVQASQINSTSAVYLFETNLVGVPSPQPLGSSPSFIDEPYHFNGQIFTEQGFGSGVVAKRHTVLTAGHVLFDDTRLAHVTTVLWFFQRNRGTYDLPPQSPRGWYRFDGYSAQRELDVVNPAFGPGVGSPQSQNLDAAAMYFIGEFAGRGGSGGYFASNEAPANPWLNSNRDKFLVCYPMEGIPLADRGRMHATEISTTPFDHVQNFVFRTSSFRTAPGASGAPVYVRDDTGTLFPAAIYLGGTGDSIVRAIDDSVVDLMNRAETAGSGDGNSTGGGATFSAPGTTQDGFVVGQVTANIEGTDRGRWRIIDAGGAPLTSFRSASRIESFPPGEMMMEFMEVDGFSTPPMTAATVFTNQTTIITGVYGQDIDGWLVSELQDFGVTTNNGILDDFDFDGLLHLIEFAFGLSAREVGYDGLPIIASDGDRLTITYRRRRAELNPGITYTPEFGTSLGADWAGSARPEIVTPMDEIWEEVTVEDEQALDGTGIRFGRVRISVP